jgi:hypothetical protein
MTEVARRRGGPSDIQDAWRIMAAGAANVAQVLVDIAEDPDAPSGARVQASMAILDRVGLGARPEIVVRTVPMEFDQASQVTDLGKSPAQVVQERLAELAAVTDNIKQREREEAEIIDAILVEEER